MTEGPMTFRNEAEQAAWVRFAAAGLSCGWSVLEEDAANSADFMIEKMRKRMPEPGDVVRRVMQDTLDALNLMSPEDVAALGRAVVAKLAPGSGGETT